MLPFCLQNNILQNQMGSFHFLQTAFKVHIELGERAIEYAASFCLESATEDGLTGRI